MHLDADAKLEEIDPDVRHVPEVLAVRLQSYCGLKKWELMQTVASKLAKHDPNEVQWAVSWAYATRRADSIEIARNILLHALERHPEATILHFNLACYECQLVNMEEAKERLGRTVELAPQWRMLAMEDEDLKLLWDSLGSQKNE